MQLSLLPSGPRNFLGLGVAKDLAMGMGNDLKGQNFGLSKKVVCITVFITGKGQGEFQVSASTELKSLANRNLMEWRGQKHIRIRWLAGFKI